MTASVARGCANGVDRTDHREGFDRDAPPSKGGT